MDEQVAEDPSPISDTIANNGTADQPPEWVLNILKWAASDPWGFISTLFLYLSPLFFISAILSWKLAKMIDAKEKAKKKSNTKSKNTKKVKRRLKAE